MTIVSIASKILHNSATTYSTTWDTYLQPTDLAVLRSGEQAWDVDPGKLATPIYLDGGATLGLYGSVEVTLRLVPAPGDVASMHNGPYGGLLDIQGDTKINVTSGGFQQIPGQLNVQMSADDTFRPTGTFINGGGIDIWKTGDGYGSVQGANLSFSGGARGQFWTDIQEANTFNLNEGSGKFGSPSMEIGSVNVSDGTTINLNGGTLTLWEPMRFLGTVHNGPAVPSSGLGGGPNVIFLQGMTAASVGVAGGAITFFDADGAIEKVLSYDDPKASIGVGTAGILISDEGLFSGYSVLPTHIA